MANTWISLAVPANPAAGVESDGNWAVQAPADGRPAIAVTDLHRVDVSLVGRNFRRRTRACLGS